MQYLLLIYSDESDKKMTTQGDTAQMMKEYGEFTASIMKTGNMKGGDALQPSSTATTVRVREGKTLTTDGPYAETREQLAGYYLVEAPDLDAAIAWGKKIPGGPHYSIEVRPIHAM